MLGLAWVWDGLLGGLGGWLRLAMMVFGDVGLWCLMVSGCVWLWVVLGYSGSFGCWVWFCGTGLGLWVVGILGCYRLWLLLGIGQVVLGLGWVLWVVIWYWLFVWVGCLWWFDVGFGY